MSVWVSLLIYVLDFPQTEISQSEERAALLRHMKATALLRKPALKKLRGEKIFS